MLEFKVSLTGRWTFASAALLTASRRIKSASDRALMQEAQHLRKQLVQGIRKQAPGGRPFAKLKSQTLKSRKQTGFSGTKALIRTGDFVNSIQVSKVGQEGVFVGILRSSMSRGGEMLVNIAKIHEFGAPRANIPPRPVFEPVFKAEKDNIRKRFVKNMARNLGGVFGTGAS